MKMPDPKPLGEHDSRIIAETIERLKNEAMELGYRQKLAHEYADDVMNEVQKENEGGKSVETAMIGIMANRLTGLRINLRIEMAVIRKILEVLLTHLKEDSHRDAVRALKGLHLQDIV